ncbi:hypothetical protein KQI68_03325 [Peptoniphilus sp. MSJ-1]|uniref:HTH cro/C1-type domain-containing protein n=1 Tax=Peptoniphilus ovalis TaxID=2841503 RepID=A0ABS6FHZ3_9FIRM|nr:hypothetical protein [Peptoniphilus ovalis]MBU5668866.1 hypothetical protein [Peptoniphilus ovalis]
MLTYNQVFKALIDLSNTKLSTIAYKLGYDISYISKWNSGKKLPSYKNIYDINRKLSFIFTTALLENEKVNDFITIFQIKNLEMLKENTEEALKAIIFKLLNDSYNPVNTNNTFRNHSSNNFIFKNNNLYNEFKEVLKKIIIEDKDLDIWVTFDINSQYGKILLQSLKNHAKTDSKINLHIFCNLENLDKNEFLKIITENPSVNIELFESKDDLNTNFILIKDKIYFMFNERINEYYSMNYGNEIETLFEFSSYINNLFEGSKKIISLSSQDEIAEKNYRKYFYSDNEFLFLSNYGFEFLIPNNILDKVLKTDEIKYEKNKSEILDIKLLWKELFVDSSINFLTTRTSLLNYLESGNILYCSINTTLTPENIEEHLQNIIKAMRNNENINFYIINDDRFLKSNGLDKFNFFVNENNMYFKKTNHNSSSPTSIVEDVNIHNNIYETLHKIMNSSFSIKYSADELESFFQKYSKIFQRISDKNK